jgi:hypothetical protein
MEMAKSPTNLPARNGVHKIQMGGPVSLAFFLCGGADKDAQQPFGRSRVVPVLQGLRATIPTKLVLLGFIVGWRFS